MQALSGPRQTRLIPRSSAGQCCPLTWRAQAARGRSNRDRQRREQRTREFVARSDQGRPLPVHDKHAVGHGVRHHDGNRRDLPVFGRKRRQADAPRAGEHRTGAPQRSGVEQRQPLPVRDRPDRQRGANRHQGAQRSTSYRVGSDGSVTHHPVDYPRPAARDLGGCRVLRSQPAVSSWPWPSANAAHASPARPRHQGPRHQWGTGIPPVRDPDLL